MGDWESVQAENLVRHVSGIYYLRAKVGGKIIRRSLRTRSLRTAKMKRDMLMPELRIRADAIRRSESWSLREACAMTGAYYRQLQLKPSTLHYREQMIAVLKRTLPNRNIATLTAEELEAWWNSPAIAGYSWQRQNNILGTLRKLFALALKAGVVQGDPSVGLPRRKGRKHRLELPDNAAFKTLLTSIRAQGKANSDHAADMVAFLAYSGCRIAEAQHITWRDVGKDSIRITGGPTGTKNQEERQVPITGDMRAVLKRLGTGGRQGKLFALKSPRQALENACQRLDIPHMRIHDLRHYFATRCIESGVDIPTVARWLGHKDGGVLAMKTYGHLRDEHSLAAAKKVRF